MFALLYDCREWGEKVGFSLYHFSIPNFCLAFQLKRNSIPLINRILETDE